MKQTRILLGMAFCLVLFSNSLFAQHKGPHHRPPHDEKVMEMMKEELQLSEDQLASIKSIQEKYREQFQELRSDSKDNERPDIEKMEQLREAKHNEIMAVLTETQRQQFDQKMADRHQKRMKRARSPEGKDLRKEMKAYVEQNILPVMADQRQKLEKNISAEDKTQIAAIRKDMNKLHEERKKAFKNALNNDETPSREEVKAYRNSMREKHQESLEKTRELVLKYDDQIVALFDEIKPKTQQWEEDLNAIAEKHQDQTKENEDLRPLRRKRRAPAHDIHKMLKKGRFLLMDPSKPETLTTENAGPEVEVRLFPNPTNGPTTISYTLYVDSEISIEIRNEQGSLVKTIDKGLVNTGLHRETIDLSSEKSGIYYVSLIQNGNLISETVSLQK